MTPSMNGGETVVDPVLLPSPKNLLSFLVMLYNIKSDDKHGDVAHVNLELSGRSEEVVAINTRAHGAAITPGGAVTTTTAGKKLYIRATDQGYFPLQYVLLWPHGDKHGYVKDMKGAGEKVRRAHFSYSHYSAHIYNFEL
jgi:hypothetical protein